MNNLTFIIGVLGNIISVLLFLSPTKTFIRIVWNRSTEEFSSIPYICTLFSSSIWTYYGIIRHGAYLVATINGFGAIVELVYIALFLIFASTPQIRVRSVSLLLLVVGLFGAIFWTSQMFLDNESRVNAIGLLGAALNIVMYASPLAALRAVVTSGSVEYMPFLLSLFVFVNSGVWTFYALLASDIFLAIPNATGCVLGAIQLAVYGAYSRNKPKQQEEFHEHLIP